MAFSVNNQSSLWHSPITNTEHGHIHDMGSFSNNPHGLAHMNAQQLSNQSNVLDTRNQGFVLTHSASSASLQDPRNSGDAQHSAVNSFTAHYQSPRKSQYVAENEYSNFNYPYERGQSSVQIDVREFMHNFERQVQGIGRNGQQVMGPDTEPLEEGEIRVGHIIKEHDKVEERQKNGGVNVKIEVDPDITENEPQEKDVSNQLNVGEQQITSSDDRNEENCEKTSSVRKVPSGETPSGGSQVETTEDATIKSTPESSPRKNKRKISRAQKRQKPETEQSAELADSPALFMMVRKESAGNVVNVTEDSLKAMIEESLKNITAGKKGKIDTKDIVDASLKTVTAAVMATAAEEPSPGPSPAKKRRKKSSPRKLEVQNKDTDYDPVMDEDTELDEEWLDTPQVKRSKVKRKRQAGKKKKKAEPKGDAMETVEEGEGQSAERKDETETKKPKKMKAPRPKKKEKGPRIREKKELMCEICGKVFMRNDLLRNHKRCHSGDKPFTCTECGVSFREAGHLRRHMSIHTGKKPFKCDICGKELNSSLSKHRRRHLNDRQFPCTMCDKRFVCAFELKQHTQSHFKSEHMPCAICGRLCATAAVMKRHLESHSEVRNHTCPVCGQKFKTKQDCERHETVHYPSPMCTCHLCGKQFTQERYLKRHIDRHNKPSTRIGGEEPTPEKPFQCKYCFKTFPTTTNLNQHLALHNNKGYYPCYICSKMFTQQKYLKRHIKRHLGEEIDSSEESMLSAGEEELSHSLPPYGTVDGEEQPENTEPDTSHVVHFPEPEQSVSGMEEQVK